jgi:FkbM family methyltransferase
MSFISYAQNFEDVMLWRALKHVENGFYIDIGAQDPIIDSVSLAFYEHGWRGVHVEPTQQYSDKLRMARPDETVLQVAIGNQAGTLTFYEFENTGLSTADSDIAHRHQEAGFFSIETLVPVISLDALFERVGEQHVHWLKLDVEGLEKAVLESWRHSHVLPWILVIESTRPLTQDQSHDGWEQLLLIKGYRYVYFDGLNRFYVSPDHVDLVKAFSSPPNFFDNFVLSASQPFSKLVETKAQQAETKAQQAETKAQQAETKAQQAETKAQQAETKAQQAETKAQQSFAQTQALLSSTSWRITAPLRAASYAGQRLVLAFREHRLLSGLKRRVRAAINCAGRWVLHRPLLKKLALSILDRLPGLRMRLRRIVMESSVTSSTIMRNSVYSASKSVLRLSPRAKLIYADLKDAIERGER